jgi:hypothetical protein
VAGTHVLWLAVIAGVACHLYGALFTRDPITTHEGLELYFRTHQYLEELGNGHWLPQLMPDAVRGAGSAFPSFYPPVAYFVATSLAFVTGDVVRGVNLALLLSAVLSGWAAYFMVTVITRHRVAAVVAAVLYLSFPYHFVVVFVRGALAEAWAFVWLPLILAGTWRAVNDGRVPWYFPAAWAALLLTHVPTALYFGFPCAVIALLGLRRHGRRLVVALAVGAVVAAGLTAWFLLPQQRMLGDVRASDPTAFYANDDFVHQGRVAPGKLLGDWRNGWRGVDEDLVLPDGALCPRIYCGRSFVLGTVHLMMAALVVAAAGVLLAHRVAHREVSRELRAAAWFTGALLLAYAFNLAFIVRPRPFLRVLPSPFGYIQFPWRLVGVLALLAITVVAVVIASRLLPGWVTGVVLGLTAVIAMTVPSVQRSPARYRGVDERELEARLPASGDRGFTTAGEYLPKSVDPYDIDPYLIDEPQVRGRGRVVRWDRVDGDLDVSVEVRGDAVVVFPLLYYDVYRVTAPGRGRLDTFPARGLLAARVPAGTTAVHVSHGLTGAGRLGAAVSALAVLLFVAFSVRRARRSVPAEAA